MNRAAFAAISALRFHQIYMDVISNNISNINTPGFKGSRVSFTEALAQTIRGAEEADESSGRGSVNPMQIGLGMTLGGIATDTTQGDFQPTGRPTDLAIDGEGFFLVNNGEKTTFTRDGAFEVSQNGTLLNPSNGQKLQGWSAKDGVIQTNKVPGDLILPLNRTTAGTTTSAVSIVGNLSAGATAGASSAVSAQLPIYDTLGSRHLLTVTMTKTADPSNRQWSIAVSPGDPNDTLLNSATIGVATPVNVNFDPNGQPDVSSFVVNVAFPAGGPTVGAPDPAGSNLPHTGNITFDVGRVSQVASDSSLNVTKQDGHESGSLVNFNITPTGQIVAIFSNGTSQVEGQIALARFANPSGLAKQGGNTFDVTSASGQPVVGLPGSGGRGELASGELEMSNVNLAQQFTNMISAQRGFQANARMITTTDEMAQDLINLKR